MTITFQECATMAHAREEPVCRKGKVGSLHLGQSDHTLEDYLVLCSVKQKKIGVLLLPWMGCLFIIGYPNPPFTAFCYMLGYPNSLPERHCESKLSCPRAQYSDPVNFRVKIAENWLIV